MPQTDDFHKIVVKGVKLVYPRLNHTYRFNPAERRSEPCAQTAAKAAWSCGFEMPIADARKLHAELKAHYEARRAVNQKLPAFSKIFGMKKDDANGVVAFAAKRNGVRADGQKNAPPKVVDGMKQPLEDLNIWSGSIGSIIAQAVPVVDSDGVGGISLLLTAVQVTQPIYGGDGLDDFDTVAPTAPANDLDDFGPTPAAPPAVPVQQRAAPQHAPIDTGIDDDIPF